MNRRAIDFVSRAGPALVFWEKVLARAARTKNTGDGARLDPAAWTKAALEVLAEEGIQGVRVEALAQRLGVTKGSFYYHFKERNTLFDAMLDEWRRSTTLDIISRIDRSDQPVEARLRRLLRLPLAGPRSDQALNVELSIRLWSRQYPKAHAAVEEVDQLRLSYLIGMLQGCGVPKEEATARAVLITGYMRVASSLMRDGQANLMTQCEDILLDRVSTNAKATGEVSRAR